MIYRDIYIYRKIYIYIYIEREIHRETGRYTAYTPCVLLRVI